MSQDERKDRIVRDRTVKIIKIITVLLLITGCICFAGCSGEGKSANGGSFAEGELKMVFFDVGQADATLLISDGEAMLVDTGNRDDDTLLVNSLHEMGIEELKYIVFTHPHEDHIGSGEDIIDNFGVEKIYMLDEYDGGISGSLAANISSKGIPVEAPYPEDKAQFGECEIEFVGPYSDYEDTNDDSICLIVRHGENSMMFTGDAGRNPEREMIEAGVLTEVDLLQAGHHGSSTASSYYFLREINPKYVVISCGVGNMYGHPHEEALSRFNDLGAEIFRTDEQGTIIAISDGNSIEFNCEGKKADKPHNDGYEDAKYIGNINSKKYHSPDCGGLPNEENRVYFMSIEQAEKAGYEPCGNCRPQ